MWYHFFIFQEGAVCQIIVAKPALCEPVMTIIPAHFLVVYGDFIFVFARAGEDICGRFPKKKKGSWRKNTISIIRYRSNPGKVFTKKYCTPRDPMGCAKMEYL